MEMRFCFLAALCSNTLCSGSAVFALCSRQAVPQLNCGTIIVQIQRTITAANQVMAARTSLQSYLFVCRSTDLSACTYSCEHGHDSQVLKMSKSGHLTVPALDEASQSHDELMHG